MDNTEIVQNCYGVTVDPTTVEYRIETTVQEAGELPSTFVFVYTIGNANDPTADTFSRVGNPQDIQNLQKDRDDAIANNETEYLSSYNAVQYDNLDVAVQAKSALTTRINELINLWIEYRDNFENLSGDIQLYPTVDPGYEEALINTYTEARDDRIAKEDAVVDAQTVQASAETDLSHALDILEIYVDETEFCDNFKSGLDAFYQDIETLLSVQQIADYDSFYHFLTDFCIAASSNVAAWSNQVSAKKSAVESATVELSKAEQELAVAQTAEDEALAAIRAVCPSFDPSSV